MSDVKPKVSHVFKHQAPTLPVEDLRRFNLLRRGLGEMLSKAADGKLGLRRVSTVHVVFGETDVEQRSDGSTTYTRVMTALIRADQYGGTVDHNVLETVDEAGMRLPTKLSCATCADKTVITELLPGQDKATCPSCGRQLFKQEG